MSQSRIERQTRLTALMAVVAAGLLIPMSVRAQEEHSHQHQEMPQMAHHEHAPTPPTTQAETASGTAATQPASPEVSSLTNTMCPVMNLPVNREFSVEYRGQRVYFCCGDCPERFLANPTQYLAKLPQFGGTESNAESAPEHTHEGGAQQSMGQTDDHDGHAQAPESAHQHAEESATHHH